MTVIYFIFDRTLDYHRKAFRLIIYICTYLCSLKIDEKNICSDRFTFTIF